MKKQLTLIGTVLVSLGLGLALGKPIQSIAEDDSNAMKTVVSSESQETLPTSTMEGSSEISTDLENSLIPANETLEESLVQEAIEEEQTTNDSTEDSTEKEILENTETVQSAIETQEDNEAIPQVTTVKTETIENEDVSIYYRKLSNGQFDLIIEPKDGKNISSEWELQDMHYYKDVYLVGTPENVAKKFWETNWSDEPFLWNQ